MILALFGEGVARADGKPLEYPAACAEVRPEAAEEARKTFLAGKTKADESSYDEAVTLLLEAYRKDCTRHAFLQIIASVLEKQGRHEDAIVALTLVLERQAMTGAERAPLETKVKNLRVLVEEKKKRDAAAAAAGPAKKDPPPTTAPSGEVREHTLPPWLVFAGGAVATATGAVLLTVAAVIDPGERCVTKPEPLCTLSPADLDLNPQQRANRLESYQTNARLVSGMYPGGAAALIGGVVLMTGGLVWHFLEPTGPVTTAKLPKLLPSLAPGYGGVTVGGAF